MLRARQPGGMWLSTGQQDVLTMSRYRVNLILKAHTHYVIHDHVDRTFDRSPLDTRDWNIHVLYESTLKSLI